MSGGGQQSVFQLFFGIVQDDIVFVQSLQVPSTRHHTGRTVKLIKVTFFSPKYWANELSIHSCPISLSQ